MTDDNIKKIFKGTNSVKLEEQKKAAIRQNVLSFMKDNPYQQNKKAWFTLFAPTMFQSRSVQVALAGILLFFLVGGITVAKADYALPGDLLYPVKLGFNEKIQEVLAFSDQAKLNVNIKLAELRLQEAEQLTVQGKLTSSDETQISNNFAYQMQATSREINILNQEKMQSKVAVITANFEASLKAHEVIINALQKDTKKTIISPLLNNVQHATIQISKTNAVANDDTANSQKTTDDGKVIQQKISAIENSIGEQKNFIENNQSRIGNNTANQSEDNLNSIQQKLDEIKTQIQEYQGNNQGLIPSLQATSITTQESKDLTSDKTNLGINAPININIESSGSDASQNNQTSSSTNTTTQTQTNTSSGGSQGIQSTIGNTLKGGL